VNSAEKGGPTIDPVGYDTGKKVKGVKYHIFVDIIRLAMIKLRVRRLARQ
jgi:hypothetical protein